MTGRRGCTHPLGAWAGVLGSGGSCSSPRPRQEREHLRASPVTCISGVGARVEPGTQPLTTPGLHGTGGNAELSGERRAERETAPTATSTPGQCHPAWDGGSCLRSWERLPEAGHDRSKPPGCRGSPAHRQGTPLGACQQPPAPPAWGRTLLPAHTAEPWKCLLRPQTSRARGPRALISPRHLPASQLLPATVTKFPCAPSPSWLSQELAHACSGFLGAPLLQHHLGTQHLCLAQLSGAPSPSRRQGAQSPVPQRVPSDTPSPTAGTGAMGGGCSTTLPLAQADHQLPPAAQQAHG